MSEDHELLRSYATCRSESAFAQLVSRNVDFVYSTALRTLARDSHLAQDVTQSVFIDLSNKASSLLHLRSLEAWLYQATRFAAAKAVRTEHRRSFREQVAIAMEVDSNDSTSSDSLFDWDRIAPILDEAIEQLAAKDREAILLRFFARKNLRAVAESVGITEEAARNRVSRALVKLRAYLLRSGLNISENALIAAIATGVAVGAPPALVTTITSAAIAAPIALNTTATLLHLMTTAKTKIVIGSLGVLIVPLVIQHERISTLEGDNQKLTQQLNVAVAALNSATPLTNATFTSSREYLELMRLRAEVTALRRANQQTAQPAPPARTAAASPLNEFKPEFVKWAETILSGPPEIQGVEGGNIRRKSLSREELSEGEQTLLMNMVRQAKRIENSPDTFTAFQSSFVASLLNWNDDPRLRRVKEIILDAATTANEQQMNFNAPAPNADSWPAEQNELNRTATAEIQSLLTQEERATFDRAFLGIMGIDFGVSFGNALD